MIELGQPVGREDLGVGVKKAQPPVLEMGGRVSVRGEVQNRSGVRSRRCSTPSKRRLELGGQRLGDVIEEHHQLVLDAGWMSSVGGQKLLQRSGPEGSPDEVHDRDHGEDTNGDSNGSDRAGNRRHALPGAGAGEQIEQLGRVSAREQQDAREQDRGDHQPHDHGDRGQRERRKTERRRERDTRGRSAATDAVAGRRRTTSTHWAIASTISPVAVPMAAPWAPSIGTSAATSTAVRTSPPMLLASICR